MDKIIRCITSDGSIMASCAETSDIVHTAKKLHHTSPVATAALGRMLTGASMMGAQLKSKNGNITLRINGGGPIGCVVALADSNGNCRGYVGNPDVETERYNNGKLNVGKAVGTNGTLNVMKDFGEGEPYLGAVEIVSGEIAEDITSYYASSEQLPTACALGVLVDKNDGEVLLCGGYIIQLLPGADEEAISRLEKNLASADSVTTMLAKGMSVLDMVKSVLSGFEVEVLDEMPINYVCTCSRDKVINSIITLPDDDIRSLADEKGYAVANCHFCNKHYRITKSELEEIIKMKNSDD